jgi:hypothetical protein
VLAQGDLADYIRRKLPMLTELPLVDALILDRVAELHNDLVRVALKAVSEELQQTRAKSEAQLADFLARMPRREFRAHGLSSAVARAEFIQQQRELEAENAKRDAAAAREAATGLQNLVLRLHEELRSRRADILGLQQQVAELQHSRWRRIGLLLGLERKATFER